MSVYLVTWNLNKEGLAYSRASQALHARLDTLTTIKGPGLESVRFVSDTRTATGLCNYITQGILDSNDRIVVSRLHGGEAYGVWDTGVSEWISARL